MSTPQVVLVTGASTGIGKACATYLATRGHRVYGTSRRAPEEFPSPGAFRMIRMDVTDSASVSRGVALMIEAEERVDAVVNNAGIHIVGPVECLSIDDIETSFRTNCLGAIRVCKEVLPRMRENGGGRIINISSAAGLLPLPFQGAYCGSKFALEAMTEVFRAEVRPFGIKVSLIEPGDIRHQDCHGEAQVLPAYEKACARAMKVAWADEEKGFPPERIGPLVEKIIASPNPRVRYSFGPAYQAAALILRRILPNRLAFWALGAYYGL